MPADKRGWYIGVFEEDDTAEIVPDFWMREDGKIVVWPPWNDSKRIMRAE